MSVPSAAAIQLRGAANLSRLEVEVDSKHREWRTSPLKNWAAGWSPREVRVLVER